MDSRFKDIEFKDMKYNPIFPKGKSVFTIYPELARQPEFKASPLHGLDNKMVMQYIFCMYDKKTPYRLEYPNSIQRKLEIAKDVGFEMDGNKFVEDVDNMIRGKNIRVQRKITAFIRLLHDYQWTYHIALEENYYNLLHNIMSGKSAKMNELNNIKSQLENSLEMLKNSDDSMQLTYEILEVMDEEREVLRPERVAEMMADGEDPFPEDEIFADKDEEFLDK